MIVKKTVRELWPMFVIFMLVMEIILLPAISLWPDLEVMSEKLGPLLLLKNFLKASVFRDVLEAVGNYGDYFALQAFFKGANICGAAAAVLVGTGLVARERENHTLEFLITRPVSPSRVLFAKFSVAAVGLIVPIFAVAWSGIPLSAWLVEEELQFYPITLAAWHASIFVICMLALTTLCSVIFRLQAHTAAVAGTFIVIQVTLFFIQTARVYSLFQVSDVDIYAPIIAGKLDATTLLTTYHVWMFATIAVLYLIADRLFRRISL